MLPPNTRATLHSHRVKGLTSGKIARPAGNENCALDDDSLCDECWVIMALMCVHHALSSGFTRSSGFSANTARSAGGGSRPIQSQHNADNGSRVRGFSWSSSSSSAALAVESSRPRNASGEAAEDLNGAAVGSDNARGSLLLAMREANTRKRRKTPWCSISPTTRPNDVAHADNIPTAPDSTSSL